MKKFLVVLVLLTNAKILSAQVAISYFPFQSVLSVSTKTDRLLFLDFKLETNGFVSNLNMELSPKLNFVRKELVNYYFGPGFSLNPTNGFADLPLTNGYFVDFGIRAKPWEKFRQFQVVFEISPYVNQKLSSGNLRARLGVAWQFDNKNRQKETKE